MQNTSESSLEKCLDTEKSDEQLGGVIVWSENLCHVAESHLFFTTEPF